MNDRIRAQLASQLAPFLPDAMERMVRLAQDGLFREMCSEYQECAKCLQRWKRSREKHAHRIEEYTQLLAGLRQEILRYLQDNEKP